MTDKKTTTSKAANGNGKDGGHVRKDSATRSRSQSQPHHPDGKEQRSPSADELGQRAWAATYKNKNKH